MLLVRWRKSYGAVIDESLKAAVVPNVPNPAIAAARRKYLECRGFGDGKRAFFWLKKGRPDPQAVHVGFVANDHAEVDAFYKAAVGAGGKSKESQQARPEYYPGYYATWVLDPDGHDIEVVHKS